jgi:glycosidase
MAERDPNAIDAIFLSNHDNNRIASRYPDETLLKAMAKLYMTLPGTIVTYYGEEVGMKGEGIDENKRGPMDWVKGDETCKGPEAMNTDTSSAFGSVEEQKSDENSILNFYKEMLSIRNKYETIAKGKAQAMAVEDSAICAYELTYNNQTLFIIHNFADEDKTIELSSYNLTLLENITCKDNAENTFDDTTKELKLSPYGGMIFEVK